MPEEIEEIMDEEEYLGSVDDIINLIWSYIWGEITITCNQIVVSYEEPSSIKIAHRDDLDMKPIVKKIERNTSPENWRKALEAIEKKFITHRGSKRVAIINDGAKYPTLSHMGALVHE